MNNEIRPPTWFALAASAAFAGGFLALWLTDYAVIRADWCSGVEAACARAWIASFSGWAAAAAAASTIWVLLAQLRAMREQADFVNGFASPGITLTRSVNGAFEQTLKVTNWNRHQIEVFEIQSHPDSEQELLDLKQVDNNLGIPFCFENEDGEGIKATSSMLVPGWTNRNDPPPVREIEIGFTKRTRIDGAPAKLAAGCRVKVRILDDQHTIRSFDVWTHDAFVF